MVLAAGGASRFAGADHKLLTPFRGRPLASWAVEAALAAGFEEVVVVTGAVDLDLPAGVTELRNDEWADGMATSLQRAVAHARERAHDAIVVGLGDQPLVPAAAWAAVAAADAPVVTATFGGERRPPVRLAAAVWPLLPAAGDEGARAVMRSRPDLVVEVACDGQPADIDTAEDLARWS